MAGSIKLASAANSVVILDPVENERLANLCGQFDEHIRLLERRLGVDISQRGNEFTVIGSERAV
ncbi:MAG: phosphate starvation-inducible protein PhoH, partial [Gammaproteobacteria bacterium]|nr:phosphate starvation-inducible protein PhoH [Gammaproteobacteria bacterium]